MPLRNLSGSEIVAQFNQGLNIYCVRWLKQSRSRLEQVLVVVVDVVQECLLGDLPEYLVHHGVGNVVPQEVQHKTVGSTKFQIFEPPCSHLSHQHRPGEVWDHDPGEPVHQAHGGDSNEEEPPEPEDEEILLVEDVVVEDAQVVAPVDGSRGGADPDIASNLGHQGLILLCGTVPVIKLVCVG